MASPQDQSVFTNLPDVTTAKLKTADRKTSTALLEELDGLSELSKTTDERITEIKDLLAGIQDRNHLAGLRFGNFAFRTLEVAGRKTLDKALLVQNGVDPETIEASMKEGKPSMRREFKRLNLE